MYPPPILHLVRKTCRGLNMSNSGFALCGQHTAQKNIIYERNFGKQTASGNITSVTTLAGAVTRYSSSASQCPPNASKYIVTALGDSDDAGVPESEASTPPRLLCTNGYTQVIEDIHIGEITRKNYMCSLVKIMFWILDYHPNFLVHL